jgi:hypothetical protein
MSVNPESLTPTALRRAADIKERIEKPQAELGRISKNPPNKRLCEERGED